MKKYALIILSLMICSYAFDADAAARRYIPKPYIGVDYMYTKLKYKSDYGDYFDDEQNSYGINIGLRMTEYFGMELYYQPERNNTVEGPDFISKGKFASYSLDFIGYLPSRDLSFSGLILVGGGAYEYRGKVENASGRHSETEHMTNLRMGLGLQYNITRGIAIRAIGRYVMSSSDYVRNHLDGSIGIQLAF